MSPILTFLSLSVIAAQSSNLEHLVNTNDIVQDQQGFIWLADHQGLTRFDGEKLLSISPNNNQWPIPFSWTHDIDVTNNQLLISTESHKLWLFDPQTTKTSQINVSISGETIYNATLFNNNYYFYTVSPRNLYRFDPKTSSTHLIRDDVMLNDLFHNNHSLYFFNYQGLFEIKNDTAYRILNEKVDAAVAKNDVLVVATPEQLIVYKNNQQIVSKKLAQKVVSIAFEHNQHSNSLNFFTIDQDNIINKYDINLTPLEHSFKTTTKAPTKKLFHDTSNALWLITNSGIKRLSASNIKNYPRIYETAINAIEVAVAKDQVIIGSYGDGLHSLNEDESIIPSQVNLALNANGKRVTDMLPVGDDLYLATFDGLWRYDFNTQLVNKLPFENNNKILLKLRKKDNLLYVTTDENGFYIYDLAKQEIVKTIDETYPFSSPEIIDILPINNTDIWLATAKGLDVYHHINKSISQIDLSISSKVIALVHANGKIFAATKTDGIFVFNEQQQLLSRFAIGIDFVQLTLINNEVWAPSKTGVYRISPVDNQLSMVPGTESYAFSSDPVLKDDTVYIGHYGGVLAIPLAEQEHFDAKIYISDTTVSGQQFILNKAIKNATANDVITLNLASLDYRQGQQKQFKYQINNGSWNKVNSNQITLTGLASGSYYLTIMGTNSLGQWSNFKAYTEIHIAYPWYWTPTIRIVYLVIIMSLCVLTAWLLYLRERSIRHIHSLLSDESHHKNRLSLDVSRNLFHALNVLNNKDFFSHSKETQEVKDILQKSIEQLKKHAIDKEPNNLDGKQLSIALPFLLEYLYKKHHIKVQSHFDIDENKLSYQLQADIYKIIYEAITSAILLGDGNKYALSLKEQQSKIWLTVQTDSDCFVQYDSKINFDMAMYYIRQISNKYNASINTFNEQNTGSQLVISIPILPLS